MNMFNKIVICWMAALSVGAVVVAKSTPSQPPFDPSSWQPNYFTQFGSPSGHIWVDTTANRSSYYINIRGDIIPGDVETFFTAIRSIPGDALKRTFVALESEGGDVETGLNIGSVIRNLQLSTVVYTRCASACGLIWLAGTHLFGKSTARIGFHAAYSPTTYKVSSNGNAIVGAYLWQLGFGYDAIEYLTQAAPQSMEWPSPTTAKQYGIYVTVLQ